MKRIFFMGVMALMTMAAWAVPARREPIQMVQPNGDTITVMLVGDERWHSYFTEDGLLIAKNEKGYFCYAKWDKKTVSGEALRGRMPITTKRVAKDAAKRSKFEQRWITRHKIATR